MCIGTDGNLWVGLFNSREYHKISSADGSVLAGPVSTAPTAGQPNAGSWTPYGCLIDQDGTLWSASLSGILGRITNTQSDTSPFTAASFNSGRQNYGIALGNDRVYLGDFSGIRYQEFNPATNIFSFPGQGTAFSATGISVDSAGSIVTGNFVVGGVTKYNPDGTVAWFTSTQFSNETRGVIVDQAGDVWQISRTGNRLMKYRGSDGAPLGVFPIGNHPYTYSDATGLSVVSPAPTGTWTVIFDSDAADTPWGTVS